MLPAHVIRCNGHMINGGRCKHEAEPGSVVCHIHGGAAPQVRRRAAERLIMSADHVSQKLLEWLDDPEVPYRVRAEIAQDVLDRAGLSLDASDQDHADGGGPRHAVLRRLLRATRTTGSPTRRQIRHQRSRATRPAALIITTPSQRRSWKQRSSSQKVSQPTTRRPESQR